MNNWENMWEDRSQELESWHGWFGVGEMPLSLNLGQEIIWNQFRED